MCQMEYELVVFVPSVHRSQTGICFLPVLFSVYIDGISELHDPNNGAYVILYADDILLMSHSISTLQTLLTTCENELDIIGMAINTRKSCCIHVGPRHNINYLCGN